MTPRQILETLEWNKPFSPMYGEKFYYSPKNDFEKITITYFIETMRTTEYQIKPSAYGDGVIFCKY